MTWNIPIPEEPINGFEVRWWRLNNYHTIHSYSAIFYEDTNLEDVPGCETMVGAPVVNQWVIFFEGTPNGHFEGWEGVNAETEESEFGIRFLSLLYAEDALNDAIWCSIEECDKRKAELHEQLAKPGKPLITVGVQVEPVKEEPTVETPARFKTTAELQAVVDLVEYKDWKFVLIEKSEDVVLLQIHFMAPDNESGGEAILQKGRKWYLSPWMCNTEIVQTVWAAVSRAELHEIQEQFLYKGFSIWNNHVDVDALVEVAYRIDQRD